MSPRPPAGLDTPSACHKGLWHLIWKNLWFGLKISENTPDCPDRKEILQIIEIMQKFSFSADGAIA